MHFQQASQIQLIFLCTALGYCSAGCGNSIILAVHSVRPHRCELLFLEIQLVSMKWVFPAALRLCRRHHRSL